MKENYNYWIYVIKEKPNFLHLVPEELITRELCLIAVEQYGSALIYVPEELKTEELCLIAVHQDYYNINYIQDIKLKERIRKSIELEYPNFFNKNLMK